MGEMLKTVGKETKVRVAPRHDADILSVLPEGTEVEVLEQEGRFVRIRRRDSFADVCGWVASGFLGREPEALPPVAHRPLQPCQRCLANEWGIVPVGLGGQTAPSFTLGFFEYQRLMARVCLGCGYTELTVTAEGLESVREFVVRNRTD